MKKSKMNFAKLFILCFLVIGSSCKKYLDKKPDKHLVVPTTVADLQALLDDNTSINVFSSGLGESSSDDYYLTSQDWSSLGSELDRSAYIWGDEVVSAFTWTQIYGGIYRTNVVLDNIDHVALNGNVESERNLTKGSALFLRSFFFFRLATTFALSYDSTTAAADLGIPLRLSSDFNIKSTRSTVKQTYNQILEDLHTSINLLPEYPDHVMRPSKGAAYGLLARVYLSMRNYTKAGLYADSCLKLNSQLINFNELDTTDNYPIEKFNKETLFYSSGGTSNTSNRRAKIDSSLHSNYAKNDLRRQIFFKENSDGSYAFFGSYTNSSGLFLGISTDEQYLIKAECLARADKVDESMDWLNKLLMTRWKSGTYSNYNSNNSQGALRIILLERRKELLMRNLRWQDIKRLNIEGANIAIKRVLDDKNYILPPNSPKFALPLPAYVIKMTGMKQNPR